MAAAILALLALPLLTGRVYINDDLGIFHLPLRSFYAGALARGEGFLWFPGIYCGFYLHGEGQAGLLHPLHLLLYRWLPLGLAFNLELLMSYVVLLPGTFLLLRRYVPRSDAAMLGALVFSFSGFNLRHFVHPNMVVVLAHAPWLLLALDEALGASDPRRAARARLGVGLLTASQMLLGHPQAMWLSGILEGLLFLFRKPSAAGRRIALVEAKLLGLLAGSVQLLPTYEVVADSLRADPSLAIRYKHPLEPANLLQLVAPYLTGNGVFGTYPQEFSLYTGAIASVSVVWLLMRRRELAARRLASSALALAAVSFLLTLGERGYLYRVIAALPLVGQFEGSARYTSLMHFALAAGVALAFADLVSLAESGTRVPWTRLRPLLLLPVASLVAAVAALFLRARPQLLPDVAAQLAPPAAILAGPVLLVLASGLVVAAARGARAALAAVVVFTGLDLGAYGLVFLMQPYPPLSLDRFVSGQAAPPQPDPAQRVQSDNNILTMRGLRLAGGYAAFTPRRSLPAMDGARLRVAGVRWVQTRPPWAAREAPTGPGFEEAARPEALRSHDALGRASLWREIREPLPRAWLVSEERVSSNPATELSRVDPAVVAVVAEALGLLGAAPGAVTVGAETPGEIRLRAEAPTRQLLVVSESWHRGWRVSIDGKPGATRRVDGDFLGCVLEAGAHDVLFRFQPESYRVGAWLSIAGLALLVLRCAPALVRGPRPFA